LGRPKGSESKLFFLDAHKGEIMNMLERGESVGSICEHFNVSKNTFYKYRKKFFRS
jgi:transposase-like protein